MGDLRRRWRAQSAESSIEVEGFRVPEAERLAVAVGSPAGLEDDDRLALSCYARAMDHVGVMAGDPHFRWSDRVILDLHFDACSFQRTRDPGRYRRQGIEVTNPAGGPPAYVGPPWELSALELALSSRVDRASYAVEADVSEATASNDLRRLVDAGLVVRDGQGRSTGYHASEGLRRIVSDAPPSGAK